ncbi:CASP-like protein 4A2 [Prosopis cineraria]|uniref:CASP-like protein 4A2 n=1 Tax=Prosopis cineraria TaxID=364024 RepID=UPI0024106346|nr:CASP-like protein 4A2 [Prosopis cineraria]XP_054820947.1 CASP-like protein 4A2 [Prosopis cineraria]
MKKQSSKNSEASAQVDSPHSPLRFQSPLRSEQGDPPESPEFRSPENSPDNSKAIVAVSKVNQYSPARSALPPSDRQKVPENAPPARSPVSMMTVNRAMREEPPPSVTKVGPASGVGRAVDGGHGRSRGAGSTVARLKRDVMLRRAALGFRLSEVLLCLISFSVMAADKTQGWSGDSFDRYKEYRYCLSVNVIAFVYSGFQACGLAWRSVTGTNIINHHLRCHFDFFMDQILAYLLISASSSAATRVDDWQSNWGKDKFTEMASASVGMSFLAFIAFAFSSLISGYNLCAPTSI